jgi:enterochelin esterase-like enzyme
MEPVEWAMLASATMAAVGSISQANATKQQMNSQADAANYNAIVANQNADTALQASSANEEAQRRKSAMALGQQRAGLAESGIGLESGTATELTEQSALKAEMDAVIIRYPGQTQAQAYNTQTALDIQTAQQAKANASAAMTSGYLTAGSQALSGYGKYSNYQARIKNPSIPSIT